VKYWGLVGDRARGELTGRRFPGGPRQITAVRAADRRNNSVKMDYVVSAIAIAPSGSIKISIAPTGTIKISIPAPAAKMMPIVVVVMIPITATVVPGAVT
jgi:hypothetical protein